jgi:osmotically-inducible protein OsmY
MTDRQLQQDVQHALDWEPSVDAAHVGVTVDGNVVTLRGDVKTYSEKAAAERVALRVFGVKAVANDLEVHIIKGAERNDTEIAQAVAAALAWNTMVPPNHVTVTVSNGWVTLKGEVDWQYQKEAATRAVRDLTGVRGVSNVVSVKPHVSVADVQSKIEAALKRSAEVDARRINVMVSDGQVTLSGNVHSWAEREQARHAAWAAPGVKDVRDHLAIVP